MAEKLSAADRKRMVQAAASRSVEMKLGGLAEAKVTFSKYCEEYGVEYAFRHGAAGISRADAELQIAMTFNQVMQHEQGSEKLAWGEVLTSSVSMLSGNAGSSLFSAADSDGRRGVARQCLLDAMEQLKKLEG